MTIPHGSQGTCPEPTAHPGQEATRPSSQPGIKAGEKSALAPPSQAPCGRDEGGHPRIIRNWGIVSNTWAWPRAPDSTAVSNEAPAWELAPSPCTDNQPNPDPPLTDFVLHLGGKALFSRKAYSILVVGTKVSDPRQGWAGLGWALGRAWWGQTWLGLRSSWRA